MLHGCKWGESYYFDVESWTADASAVLQGGRREVDIATSARVRHTTFVWRTGKAAAHLSL